MPHERSLKNQLRASVRLFPLAAAMLGLIVSPLAAQSLPETAPEAAPQSTEQADLIPLQDTRLRDTRIGPAEAITTSLTPTSPAPMVEPYRDTVRQNRPIQPIDGLSANGLDRPDEAPGIRFGTMILRPTISEKIVHESIEDGGGSSSRIYSETEIRATLQSDWSRHRLTIDGAGRIQNNISGEGQEEPSASLGATLDLDLAGDMAARLRAGYDFYKEDRTDPNAVSGAVTQASVHSLGASAALMKNLGRLRGTATAQVNRLIFGDASLSNGAVISGSDRDRLSGKFTGRIGYEISPSLIPFLEASVERINYDETHDANGFARSASTYAIRLGAEIPYSEKLSGEIASGYVMHDIDDSALSDIDAFTLDGEINWSPRRGTLVNAGVASVVEASTAAGQSGSVAYQFRLGIEQQVRRNLVARLSGTALQRDFVGSSAIADETVLGARTELDWSISRYLSLIADASFERSSQDGRSDSDTARVGLGLKLRR